MAASAPQRDPPSLFLRAVAPCTPHNRARARACTHARTHARVLDRAAAAPISDGWVDRRNGGRVRSERVGCTSSVHPPLDEGENASFNESQRRERARGGEERERETGGERLFPFVRWWADFWRFFDNLVFRFFWSSFLSLSLLFFFLLLEQEYPVMLLARRECSNLRMTCLAHPKIRDNRATRSPVGLHRLQSLQSRNLYGITVSPSSFLLNICPFFVLFFFPRLLSFSLSLSLFRLVRFGFTPLFIIVALLSSRDTLFLRAIAHARTAVRLRTVVNRIVGCFLYASYMPATNYHACVQSHTRERPRAAVDRNKIRNRNNGCVSWMCIYYFVTISQSCSIGVSRRRGVLLPTSGRVPLSKGPPFTRVRRPRAPVPPAIISIQK